MALDYDKYYTASLVKAIREADYLCDVTLVAGLDQRRFPVHRNVMVASSPYFKAMLGPNYKEANQKEIPLHAMSGATLNTIVNYCYSGSVHITSENVVAILAAASSLELVQLEEKCANFLKQQLDAENSIELLLIADQFNLTGLRNKAMRFFCANFDKIPSADMMRLEQKMFGEILKQDQIDSKETMIFDRFVQWTEHDEPNRSQFVTSLAKSIRLQHIPTEFQFLSERIEPFLEKYGCSELVLNHRTAELDDKGRTRFDSNCVIYCAVENKSLQNIEMYENDGTRGAEFSKIRTISIETPRKNCLFSNGKAYLFNDAQCTDRYMDSYNLKTSEKEFTTHLPLDLNSGSLITVGNYTYILGKHYQAMDDVSFTSCYRFDRERQQWEVREPLPLRMLNLSAIEMNGLIYVAGNIKGPRNHASNFWCYDPNRNCWIEKAHTNLDGYSIRLFKARGSICICNANVGFVIYDTVLNRWTKVHLDISNNIALPISVANDYDMWMFDAVEFENEQFGKYALISFERGYFVAKIEMNGYVDDDYQCSFGIDYLCYIEREGVSAGRKHLFIRH